MSYLFPVFFFFFLPVVSFESTGEQVHSVSAAQLELRFEKKEQPRTKQKLTSSLVIKSVRSAQFLAIEISFTLRNYVDETGRTYPKKFTV